MNDLFAQFESQFEKPKEAPVASEQIVARNFKDNTIPVEETYSHMDFITGHKHFCDAYGYIIPKVYRDTYWEPNQVKSNLKDYQQDIISKAIEGDKKVVQVIKSNQTNYTNMPEGMKEAQTNNGVYDHVNGFPFAPVAITHTQPIAPDQQLPEIVAKESEFEIEGETDDKGQASLFDFGEYEPSSKENLFVSGKKTDSFGSPLEESLKKINRDKMSSMEFEREYMQSPLPAIADNVVINTTPMLSKALLQSEEVPPVFTAAIDLAGTDKNINSTVIIKHAADKSLQGQSVVAEYLGRPNQSVFNQDLLDDMLKVADYYGSNLIKEETPREPKVVPVIQIEGKDFIELVILGDPTSQKRHKHRHIPGTKFVQTYDPSEGDKADFLAIVQKNAPSAPLLGPLMLQIDCFFSRPKSHYRTGKNAHLLKDDAPEWHISKPDSDNLQKFIFDALNSIYWKDDSQICSVLFQKLYDVATPRTVIKIRRP